MKLLHTSAMVLAALLSATAGSAQTGAYILFTGANVDANQTTITGTSPNFVSTTSTVGTKIYGPTFGLYANFPSPIVKIGVDARGSILNGGGSQVYYGVAGPRLEVSLPVLSLRPYIEGMGGGGNFTTLASTKADFHGVLEVAVGVDHSLFTLLDWRVIEFTYTSSINASTPIKALRTGIVLRLP